LIRIEVTLLRKNLTGIASHWVGGTVGTHLNRDDGSVEVKWSQKEKKDFPVTLSEKTEFLTLIDKFSEVSVTN